MPAVPKDYPNDQKHRGIWNACLFVDLAKYAAEEESEEDEEDSLRAALVVCGVLVFSAWRSLAMLVA